MRAVLSLIFLLCVFAFAKAQKGYAKDSLQIKIYTTYTLGNEPIVDRVRVHKVFCDYCSPIQLEAISAEARKRTLDMLTSGARDNSKPHSRITIVIRVAREDLYAIRESNEAGNNKPDQ